MIVRAEPYLYMDELAAKFNLHPSIDVTYSIGQVIRQLAQDNYSLKKMRKFAAQQDDEQRKRYWDVISCVVLNVARFRSIVFVY